MPPPRPRGVLFSFRLVPAIAGMLGQAGHDTLLLLRRCRLPESALLGEFMAPLERIQRFVRESARALDNPTFGLDLAERVDLGIYGHPALLARTSPTLGDGLHELVRYAALVNPVGRFSLSRCGDEARLEYTVSSKKEALGRHLNEYTLRYIVRACRELFLHGFPLRLAWFPHPAPASSAQVRLRFGCPVQFDQASVGFSVDASLLAQRPVTADDVVHSFLEAQAQALLQQRASPDIILQLSSLFERRMGLGDLQIHSVARELSLSPRTLQRRLLEAGTTFHNVLDDARRRQGERLRGLALAPADLARRLGYLDVRSLRRAQARWG